MSQGARFLFFWIPKTAQAFVPPSRSLTLADYVLRAGQTYTALALLQAERSGDELFDGPNGGGQLLAGEIDLDATTEISRVREVAGGNEIRLHQSGGTSLSELFGSSGLHPDSQVDFQTLAGISQFDFANAGGGFANWSSGDNDAIANDVATGDRFILAIYYPPAVAAQYEIFWPGLMASEGIDWPGESTPIDWPGMN